MIHTAYIFGTSPLAAAIRKQMAERGWETACTDVASLTVNVGDRLMVVNDDDNSALALVADLARRVAVCLPQDTKVRTLLVLQQELTLRVLRESDFPKCVTDVLDIDAVTNEDMWAERVLCSLPTGGADAYPPLDREPMLRENGRKVMFVVDGMNQMAQAMARVAALVAHYPNYVRDARLSTRIVMVHPDMHWLGEAFRQAHAPLFACSRYRVTELTAAGPQVVEVHQPELAAGCQPFVDVEWEFVCGTLQHSALRAKLDHWASSSEWLLSLALCEGTDESLLSYAMDLPEEVRAHACTVYVRQCDEARLDALRSNPRWKHIHAFGMVDKAFDALMPRVELARMLNAFYSPSAGEKGFPYNLQPDAVREAWYAVPSPALRHSNVCNVLTFPSKMRSVGHEESDPHTFYALSEQEVRMLAEVEHNRWSLERLMAGFRPPTEQEREAINRNIQAHITSRLQGTARPAVDLKKQMKNEQCVHYDLCAYSELSVDASGRDVRDYDHELIACIPVIMEQWQEMLRNETKTED